MNRILVEAGEVQPDGRVVLGGRRAAHVARVLRPAMGQRLRLGILDGDRGAGVVERVSDTEVVLVWERQDGPPPEARVDLLLALPRPKVLKRLWATLGSLGVGRIILTNASEVQREYFDTHWLEPEHYRPLLIEGLEQSGDTRVPMVQVERRFKPFVEDDLDAQFAGSTRLMAHPVPDATGDGWLAGPPGGAASVLVAVGPEGGWVAFERDLLTARGFRSVSLGWRTLRCDTACVAMISLARLWVGDY